MQKRVKVEFQDDKGTKYSLSVEGKLTPSKVAKLMELMELMDGPIDSRPDTTPDETTFFGKLHRLIQTNFPASQFSSSDLAREYEDKYGQSVKLSTISTYLARLAERGYLKRQKFSNSWLYQIAYLQSEIPR